MLARRTLTTRDLRRGRFEPNGDIRLPALRKLSLIAVYIEEETLEKLLSSFSRIDSLTVKCCYGLENLVVRSSAKLDTVEVWLDMEQKLRKVEITTPYLRTCFQIDGH